ncbi:MAG: hypothetical protein WC223_05110 [Bacteroidales bacterium]|jgi:hypothetical protein
MENRKIRNIENGNDYNYLFPEAALTQKTVKRGASVEDTVQFIPSVVSKTKWQTKQLSELLRGKSVYETCRNIWDFVYTHIRYSKDDEGREQIRSPARAWHDRFRGVDCDCYTVFISTILSNLKIPHLLRITRYKEDYFQHIYPIVPLQDGTHITVDCVVNNFNYEEPYSEKKDTKMELQFLDGIEKPADSKLNVDAQDLFGEEEIGKLFKKKTSSPPPAKTDNKKKKGKLKEVLKKGLHVVNRLNPATGLLRNGVLAAMKLNLFKIAQRLKWAYLSEAEATKRGIDIAKWKKLVTVKEKMEKIFFGAGGKPENLKSAILKGKGNKNKEVSGMEGTIAFVPDEVFGMDEETPIRELLGEEIWHSENVEGIEEYEGIDGFEGLGEPATAASVGAASGVLAIIANLLKGIGNIFPKKEKGSDDFDNTSSEDDKAIKQGAEASKNAASADKGNTDVTKSDDAKSADDANNTDASGSNEDNMLKGFWEKHKSWLKPTLWGTGILGAIWAGYKMFSGKGKKTGTKSEKSNEQMLSGLQSKKQHALPPKQETHKKKKQRKRAKKSCAGKGKKKPLALL